MKGETPRVPSVLVSVGLEGLPRISSENIETMADDRRLYTWMQSNPATRELLDWMHRWNDDGSLNASAARKNIGVADPFAASGQS